MDLGLNGQVAVVTGGTRGLGRACAELLAAEGMNVAITGRTQESADSAAAEFRDDGGEVVGIAMDLSNSASVDTAIEHVHDRWKRIDVLVANAPGPSFGPVTDLTMQDWRAAMEMNFLSMVHLTDRVLPIMRAQRYGKLHYIGTIGVRVVQPNMALSNASRLALLGYVKTLAAELGGEGIVPNFIAPGPIATDRLEELVDRTAARDGVDRHAARSSWVADLPLARAGTPDELAMLVATLSSPHCSYTTGAVVPVDGGKSTAY